MLVPGRRLTLRHAGLRCGRWETQVWPPAARSRVTSPAWQRALGTNLLRATFTFPKAPRPLTWTPISPPPTSPLQTRHTAGAGASGDTDHSHDHQPCALGGEGVWDGACGAHGASALSLATRAVLATEDQSHTSGNQVAATIPSGRVLLGSGPHRGSGAAAMQVDVGPQEGPAEAGG